MDGTGLRLGAHTSIAGGFHHALERGRAAGCDVIQVFTGSSRAWARAPISDEALISWEEARARTRVEPAMSHACYLINLGTPKPEAWRQAKAQLALELERCRALRIPHLVVHPGNHMGQGEAAGVARIAQAAREVLLDRPDDPTVLLLENTAGQGTCVGHRFEHLRDLLDAIDLPGRVGVCLDTQHLHAAGYAISSPEEWGASMDAFERIVGPGLVRAWHVNDSLRPLGSRVDRHAHLGRGLVGIEAFRCLVGDPRFRGLPMALENLRVLRQLDPTPSTPETPTHVWHFVPPWCPDGPPARAARPCRRCAVKNPIRLAAAVALGAGAALVLAPAVAQQRPGLTRGAGSAGVEKEPTFRFTTFDGRPANSDCDRNVIKVPPSYGQAFAVTTSGKQAVLWFRSNDGAVRNIFITDDQSLVTVVPSN